MLLSIFFSFYFFVFILKGLVTLFPFNGSLISIAISSVKIPSPCFELGFELWIYNDIIEDFCCVFLQFAKVKYNVERS